MTILIVTNVEDVHADAVVAELTNRGKGDGVVRLNTEDLGRTGQYRLTGGNRWDGQIELSDSGRTLQLSDVRSVWYRKPKPVEPHPSLSLAASRSFASDEYAMLLRSIYGLLSDRFWVSGYWALQRAGQKLPNLALAARLGLEVPKTLVTNQVEALRAFSEGCGWSVLAKPFALTSFEIPGADGSWASYASKVDQAALTAGAEGVPFAPVYIQEYVEKALELRVTVIGRHVFSVAIDSQSVVGATEDWRAVNAEDIPHERHQLPLEIETALLDFNRTYGLEFSTFDLILDKSGRYVFLECNPNGQWYWLETLTGLPLAGVVADTLMWPSDNSLASVTH
jgi:Glutathione synthase/Ribosomal protein S6 modification enzyme (glutaminyl transferase)